MQLTSIQQYVEIFHLVFLSQLGAKLDKSLYAIKGDCNLRFYFNSIRYSEDIDIDVRTVSVDTLRNKVSKILHGRPMQMVLNAKNITIDNFSEPKQTETTQRWKIQLITPLTSSPINTKIEFSRRKEFDNQSTEFKPVSRLLTSEYSLSPIMANHYNAHFAFIQKLQALINRTETQARDVYDLDLLMSQGHTPNALEKALIENIPVAIDNATSISYKDFKSQVVAYLPLVEQQHYADENLWNNMVITLIDQLSLYQKTS